MSDKPISVGDLVQVVRWGKCRCNGRLGLIFRVSSMGEWDAGGFCSNCKTQSVIPPGVKFTYARAEGMAAYAPVHWLRRIPPLDDLEGEKRDEKLKEPA